MKANKLFIVALTGLFITASLQAQTVLKHENHALRIGDDHHFIITNNVDEGPSGADQMWDFSDLNKRQKKGDLVSHMLDAKNLSHSNELEGSNTVIKERQNNFYFNVKNDIIEQTGYVTGNNAVVRYNDPFVKMTFPFAYGDVHSGDFSGTYHRQNHTTKIEGEYKLEADAYGTLILPGNTKINDVLRLKTTKTRLAGKCGNATTITYRWYCEEVRYPLLTIIQHQRGDTAQTTRTAYYADAWKIDQDSEDKEKEEETSHFAQQNKVQLNAYPNPFDDEVFINYKLPESSKIQINIYDNQGNKITEVADEYAKAGNYTKTLNAQEAGLVPGMYYIKVIADDTVLTQEIVRIND